MKTKKLVEENIIIKQNDLKNIVLYKNENIFQKMYTFITKKPNSQLKLIKYDEDNKNELNILLLLLCDINNQLEIYNELT
jgi:hypothetical protein